MAAFARVTGGGWRVGDDASAQARVGASGWYVVAGASGGGATIQRVTESDAAQAFTPALSIALGVTQVVERDAAHALTVGNGSTITIGQVVESNAPLAVAASLALSQAIGQVTERDSAGALTPALSLAAAIGMVTERDAAQAATYTPAGSIGQAVERDSAQPFAQALALAQAIGQVVERDAAQAVTVLQTRTIGLALEIDVAQAVTVVAGGLSVQIGQVVESSLARPFTAGAAGGTASAAEVWNYVLSNGKTAEETAVETHAMLTALSSLLAACPANLGMVLKLLRNKQITNPTTGKMTVYDDDGSTVLLEGDLFQDAAGTTPYAGAGAERRERLA